jgi:hypothetical protein
VPQMGSSRVREVESATVLVFARGDAEGLIRKVSLLKGEPVEGCQARDVVGERVCRLLSSSAEGAR